MYINDFYNVIEIDDVVKQALSGIAVYDRKTFNKFHKIEIIVPCLYHRNRNDRKGLSPELFSKVKDLEFPYQTTYTFKGHRKPSEVIVCDDFNVDKTVEGFDPVKELKKYIRVELHSSGYKCWFVAWVRGIADN